MTGTQEIKELSLLDSPHLDDLHDRLFALLQGWSAENPTAKPTEAISVLGIIVGYLLSEVSAEHREIVLKSLMMSIDGSLKRNMDS
jgi:hypothetical protein